MLGQGGGGGGRGFTILPCVFCGTWEDEYGVWVCWVSHQGFTYERTVQCFLKKKTTAATGATENDAGKTLLFAWNIQFEAHPFLSAPTTTKTATVTVSGALTLIPITQKIGCRPKLQRPLSTLRVYVYIYMV